MSARADVRSQGCRPCRMPEPADATAHGMPSPADADCGWTPADAACANRSRCQCHGGLLVSSVPHWRCRSRAPVGASPARPGCSAGGVPWAQPSTAAAPAQRPFVRRRWVPPAPFVRGRVTLLFSRGRRGWHRHRHGSTSTATLGTLRWGCRGRKGGRPQFPRRQEAGCSLCPARPGGGPGGDSGVTQRVVLLGSVDTGRGWRGCRRTGWDGPGGMKRMRRDGAVGY